jgi:very-short-patch-repair endonuclease
VQLLEGFTVHRLQQEFSEMSAIPQALSTGEETFAQHCQAYGLEPWREMVLIPGRKWRVDFYWGPPHKLAVEIEGGTRQGKSRHSKGVGFENDARKYNALARAGIILLRYSTAMVISGEAIDEVLEVLRDH